jgi:hypothetical protein
MSLRLYLSPNKVLTPPNVKGVMRIIEIRESRHVGPICCNDCKYEVRLNFHNLGTGLMLNILLYGNVLFFAPVLTLTGTN